MGTQKNSLNETVLLSTKIDVKNDGLENVYNFTLKKICLSKATQETELTGPMYPY